MTISKLEVQKIIKLASISCNNEELDTYCKDMNNIIDLFDKLKNVNTDNTKPMYSPIEDNLGLRNDEVKKLNSREDVLKNVPKTKYGFYVVPKMIE